MKYFIIFVLIFFSSCTASKTRQQGPRYPEPRQRAPSEVAWEDEAELSQKAFKGLIIIDPGHGGEDNGTKSILKPIYLEKFFNLITAKFLASYLEQMGYQILMTRTDDTFVPLKARALFANERRAKLFVSVHYNAAPSQEAKGIEIFYFKSADNPERTESSRRLASTLLAELQKTTQAPSRGVKQGNFAVIRETTMPAVLVEGGFLSNGEELEKLKDPSYLKRVAWGIAQGIHRFASSTL